MKTKMTPPEVVLLIVSSAVAISGQIAKAGTFVELTADEARPLLARGKVRVPTDEELAAAGFDIREESSQEEGEGEGKGQETMQGGAGNDTTQGGAAQDTVAGGAGNDSAQAKPAETATPKATGTTRKK